MSLLTTLENLITNAPVEIQAGEAVVADAEAVASSAIVALRTAAAAPGVVSFISMVEGFFHISPPTAGTATVIEPKSTAAIKQATK